MRKAKIITTTEYGMQNMIEGECWHVCSNCGWYAELGTQQCNGCGCEFESEVEDVY